MGRTLSLASSSHLRGCRIWAVYSVTWLVQLLATCQSLNLQFINISAYKLLIINIASS